MSMHAFQLIVLTVESCIQIVQVNIMSPKRLEIIRLINKCCGFVNKQGGQLKTILFDQAMRARSVSLNAAITSPVEGRCLCWTTY